MDRPVLLCGLGRVGWRILDHLRAAGVKVVVLDLRAEEKDPRLDGVTFIQGDCRSRRLLEQAGVLGIGGAVIVTSDDLINVSTAMLIRKLNADCRIVVRMFNQNLIDRLGGAVKNTIALSVSALTAPLLALTAVTGQAITAVKLDSGDRQLAEIVIDPGSDLVGQPVSSLPLTVVALSHGNTATLWTALEPGTLLAAGMKLIVFGEPDAIAPLAAVSRDELLGSVRWAGWVRRQFRTLRRTVADIDLPVKLATVVLTTALLSTTLVFHFALGTTWAEGFYNTVGLIATGGDLGGSSQPDWAKTFLGGMKLVGTALIAGFTAILTQYLIRARLGGALEARRIPDSGHVVVCGLGNVGFRCVEELARLHHPVVAICNTTDGEFIPTVRRMGVPVIVGNATVPAVLEQARAATAGAVIAATDSELVNLEIALLTRETNPKQRVVVRLNENDFAQAVRESANIRHALSVPALAAPAFAAALFGDRVQSLVTVDGITLALVEFVILDFEEHLIGKELRHMAAEYRVLPLSLNQQAAWKEDAVLKENDRVLAMVALADLEGMLRRR